ncbi:MAG TPA: serine--tRNA ligase, partial [Prolixibacteraceae bacterium]|nr:serine--tRNA ligase [Prolixibacteraceae bacterium]
MLTLKYLQENPQIVIEKLAKKNFNASEIVTSILDLYEKKNQIQVKADQNKAEMNRLAKEIGALMREGKTEAANQTKERTAELKENIRLLDQEFGAIDEQVQELLVQLPNLPHDSVPAGKTPDDNVVVRSGGVVPALAENAVPHWDLAQRYNLIDFELGVKLTG